ncbi:MAG: MTH1187 family thiamine-binding protein [Syntrophobacteraceae bacterium]|nr:MTH1187 family thiamine-binding protein [Syntrophobacteraceae bacterium]
MAIVEVSVVPLGIADTGLSRFVAGALKVLQDSGLSYELTAMGTIISGDLDEIWKVVRRMHESCFSHGVPRVLTHVKIDDRRDRSSSPERKVRSVMDKL